MGERENRRRDSTIKKLWQILPPEFENLKFRSDPNQGAFRPVAPGELIPANQQRWVTTNPVDGIPMIPVRVFGLRPDVTIKTADTQMPPPTTKVNIA